MLGALPHEKHEALFHNGGVSNGLFVQILATALTRHCGW